MRKQTDLTSQSLRNQFTKQTNSQNYIESESKVAQSCPTLCDPMDCSQAPPSMEFSRQEHWSGLLFPSPEDLPHPGIEPQVSRIASRCFYHLSQEGSSSKLHHVYAIATCELLGVAHKVVLREWVLKSNPVVFPTVHIRSLKRYWSLDPTPWAN